MASTWMSSTRPGDSPFADYSLSSPVFQAFLLTAAQQAVDAGADGLEVDDLTGQTAAILYYPRSSRIVRRYHDGGIPNVPPTEYSASTLALQFGSRI